MKTIIATINPVTLNFAQSVLKDTGIESFIFDTNISIMEGSVGLFPRRLNVVDEDEFAARRALKLAGLGDELKTD